jgi:hypothetical protein
VNYGKVEGHDPLDQRLQIMPNVAYKVDSEKVSGLLDPFADAGLIPGDRLGEISDWIVDIENAMVHFVKTANIARKAGQQDDQFISLAEFSSNRYAELYF